LRVGSQTFQDPYESITKSFRIDSARKYEKTVKPVSKVLYATKIKRYRPSLLKEPVFRDRYLELRSDIIAYYSGKPDKDRPRAPLLTIPIQEILEARPLYH